MHVLRAGLLGLTLSLCDLLAHVTAVAQSHIVALTVRGETDRASAALLAAATGIRSDVAGRGGVLSNRSEAFFLNLSRSDGGNLSATATEVAVETNGEYVTATAANDIHASSADRLNGTEASLGNFSRTDNFDAAASPTLMFVETEGLVAATIQERAANMNNTDPRNTSDPATLMLVGAQGADAATNEELKDGSLFDAALVEETLASPNALASKQFSRASFAVQAPSLADGVPAISWRLVRLMNYCHYNSWRRSVGQQLADEERPFEPAVAHVGSSAVNATRTAERVIFHPPVWYSRHRLRKTPLQAWKEFWDVPLHILLFLVVFVTLLFWYDDYVLYTLVPSPRLRPIFWLGLAFGMAFYINAVFGEEDAEKFITGYIYEWIFCVDDLFIYYFIFKQYSMPTRYTHKALNACLIGQLCTRFAFYLGLAHLVRSTPIIHYLAGAALVYNGMSSIFEEDTSRHEPHVDTWLVRRLSYFMEGRLLNDWGIKAFRSIRRSRSKDPLQACTPERPSCGGAYAPSVKTDPPVQSAELVTHTVGLAALEAEHGGQFFVITQEGRMVATLLLPVVLTMILTDAVLGADCTIAKIEEIDGQTWNLSSAIAALFAIRSSYVFVADLADNVSLIKYAVGFVLVFMGFELLVMDYIEFGVIVSLGIIATIILTTVLVSSARLCLDLEPDGDDQVLSEETSSGADVSEVLSCKALEATATAHPQMMGKDPPLSPMEATLVSAAR